MPDQLRVYTINRGALDAWAEEWARQVKPLREKLDFVIRGAWKVPSTNQFIWIMGYEGDGSWEVQDQAYHQSEERRAMTPDPARLIARIEHHFIEPYG